MFLKYKNYESSTALFKYKTNKYFEEFAKCK